MFDTIKEIIFSNFNCILYVNANKEVYKLVCIIYSTRKSQRTAIT